MSRLKFLPSVLLFVSLFLFISLVFFVKPSQAATLSWNTFLGGSSTDQIRGVITDSSGNQYISGYSDATWGSPVRAYTSGHDAFLAKLDSSGNLLWNTFLGGSGNQIGYSVAIGSDGSIYVVGYSDATWGTPLTAFAGVEDGYVAKLDSSGNLLWNTFVGGAGQDECYDILLDSSGNLYVLGGMSTATWGSPVRAYTASVADGFLVKLNSEGSLLWNSFLGGTGFSFLDSFAIDTQDNLIISGYSNATWGTPVNAFSSGFDFYVAKFNSSGNLVWNTFGGGSGNDLIYLKSIALDSSSNIYLTGYSTATWGSPVRAYVTGDEGFLAKFNSSGSLLWNTFLGGSGSDQPKGFSLSSDNYVYAIGVSNATWGSPLTAYVSGQDGFITKHDSSGNLLWNTFVGGSGDDVGISIKVDADNNLVFGAYSSATFGSPIRAYTSGTDAFVVEYDNDPIISIILTKGTTNGVNITWVTNEGASTKIDYGLTNSYGSTTAEADTSPRVTNHSVTLSNLAECTLYHFRVRSTDSISQETVGSDNTFKTLCNTIDSNSCSDSSPLGIASYIYSITSKSSTEVELKFSNWQTPITHFSLEYGLKSGSYIYGVNNIGDKNTTSYVVSSLKPNTKYYFRIIPKNNCASGASSNEVKILTIKQSETEILLEEKTEKQESINENNQEKRDITTNKESSGDYNKSVDSTNKFISFLIKIFNLISNSFVKFFSNVKK